MHKTTFLKVSLLALIFLQSFTLVAQNLVPFTKRYNEQIKGDMLLIGNNILGKDNNPLNDNSVNENISMQFIDIDTDGTTFSSSSATLAIPTAAACFRIAYAGLYWGALIKNGDDRTNIKNVKLKLPGNSVYTELTGEIIYDTPFTASIVPDSNRPYACYADVTSLVSSLPNAQGTYTVANVSSSIGSNGATGLSAGWTLVVVYEDPTTTTKSISTFDGFSALFNDSSLNIPVSGFITPPSPVKVNIKFGFASLNGDKTSKNKVEVGNSSSNGDAITTVERPSLNFFNSSITDVNGYFTARNPQGTNTLGYDTGTVVQNDAKKVGNNATSAVVSLQVPKGQANVLFSFFNSFLINIVAPDISLTKIVEDASGKDVGNTTINLGQDLYYKINFQNTGNDNVTNFILKDVLPKNVVFNYPSDITSLPTGVTHTYNPATRELLFTIPNDLVKIGDPINTIRLHVKVVSDYNLLSDACSNEIKNQAFATYRGVINTNEVKNEGSFNSTACNFGMGSPTNFLANIDGHTFTRTVQLCNSAVLTASNGYDSYSWSTSPTGTPVVGTSQNFTVTETGTYYVSSISNSTCKSIKEEITVIPYGNITNPVIPYADQVVTCPNNGKELPYIFLCGANATKFIQTNIAGATIAWEKLNENSCPPIGIDDCANENTSCTWTEVGQGPNYTVNTSGQFRVTINSGGCFSRFYFNVYQNILNPTETHNDIICNTPGKITIGGVPEGYEYSLDGTNYQPSNAFTITTAGTYTVYIKQIGVSTNPCVFSVPNILIRLRNFTASTSITQPACNGDKGSIRIAANDADPQYYYSIYKGVTLVKSVGPISDSYYEFESLNPGTYTVRVWTNDGCDYSKTIEIIEPPLLTATSGLTKSLTCVDGEITVYPVGGNPPYVYYVNGSTISQNIPKIVVSNPLPSGGVYTIDVFDSKNCKTTTTIAVAAIAPPVYDVTQTDVKCYGTNSGEIKFDVTNNNGYILSYGISTDNGISYTYGTNSTISNLAAGYYYVNLKYSLDGSDCLGTPEKITITTPSTALTASAGVASLAGCTLSGDGGLLRITNVQGGIGGYEYSFDGGASWQISNEEEVLPGTYVLKVRDQGGCEYTIPYSIILDEKPTAPTITVDSSAFNCDGTATSTVTVTNTGSGNYEYEYLIDGNPNPNTADPKVFLNVPSGSHIITVNYKLVSVPTYSNLLFEDFGNGDENVKSPGASPNFCFENQLGTGSCGSSPALYYGEYTVTNKLHPNSWHEWKPFPVDHSGDINGKGRFFVTDVGTVIKPNDVCYKKTIHDIIPNRPIEVEIWVRNLFAIGTSNSPDPNLILDLEPVGGTLATALSIKETGPVPRTNGWVPYKLTLNPGDNTSLDFAVRIKNPGNQGIDFAFDDIKVYQLPESCITNAEFPITVPTDKAFTATVSGTDLTCATSDDGTITIVAENFNPTSGFQYSVNGGSTWITSTVSPVKIENLVAATYDIQVRYDNLGACTLPLGTIEIKAPTPVTVLASVTQEATCSTGATIVALADGGTPAYEYELRKVVAGIETIITAFNNNPKFTNVLSGEYVVYARDAKLCVSVVGAPVSVNAPTPPTATLDATSNLCFDSNATIVVTIAGGVGPFSYKVKVDAGTYSAPTPTFTGTSFSYTATATGSYSFIVIDKNNCESNEVTQIISPKLTAIPKINKTLSCVTGLSDAIIEIEIIGGTSPYTYVVKKSAGTILVPNGTTTAPKFQYSAATDDIYTFEIKDANNCSLTVTQKVNPLVAVTAKATVTDVTCFAANNGSVILEALTGVAPFTFQLTGATLVSSSNTSASYSGLIGSVAGTSYDYIVTDSKGCVYNGTITVKQPEALEVTASITTAYTCDGPATITAVADKGNAPYTYVLKRNGNPVASNTTGVFSNLSVAGDYTVTVSDAKSCPLTVPAGEIKALNPPTAMTIGNSALTCPTNKATVTITNVTNAAGIEITSGLEYRIVAPTATVFQSSNSFADLDPGVIYTFEVKDANNCTYSKPYSIAPLPVFTVAGVVDADVQCLGETNGSATFTVSGLGNNVDYTYLLDTGASGTGKSPSTGTSFEITITGLNAGTHSITVTNTLTNCSVIASVTIASPSTALALDLDPTDLTHVTCNDLGTAVINATGGWGSYTYTVTPTVPTGTPITQYNNKNFINLSAGDYSFTVTDLKGCQVSGTFTINDKVAVVASIDGTSNFCYDPINKATIKVIPDTFTNYMYSINNGTPQNNGTFTGLTPGKYTIRVTDTSTGCYIDLAEQMIASQLTASLNLMNGPKCSSPTIQIDGTVLGGSLNYSYVVSINGDASLDPTVYNVIGNAFSYTNNVAATATTATTYLFTFTDATGCITTKTEIVEPKANPKITSATPVSSILCNGEATGSITVVIDYAFGVGPYVINVTKDNSLLPGSPANVDYGTQTSGLPAGIYIVTVTDANGCTDVKNSIEIIEPDPIVVDSDKKDLECLGNGVTKGEIIIKSVSGGTGPYDYYVTGINNYSQTKPNEPGTAVVFQVVDFGLYQIRVVDANGCSKIISDILVAAPIDYLDIEINTTADCASGGTAVVTIGSEFPSTGPFHFAVYTGPGQVFTGDGNDGWQGEMTPGSTTFTDLIPGVTYSFIVYDEITLCYYYQTATAPVPTTTSLTFDKIIANNITCTGANNGSVSFDIVNGYGSPVDVSYQVYEAISNLPIVGVSGTATIAAGATLSISNLGILPVGSYYVLVQETSGPNTGCGAPSGNFNIKESPELLTLSVSPISKNDNSCTANAGQIAVIAKGGTAPYLYQIIDDLGPVGPDVSDSAPTAESFVSPTHVPNTFNKDAGNYLVYVRDAYGCIQVESVTIDLDPSPVITAVASNQCTATEGNFTIEVELTTSGIGQHRYSVDGGAFKSMLATSFTISGLSSGTHTVEVKDVNGCGNKVIDIKIVPPLEINASFTTPPTCLVANGTITAVVNGGATPNDFEYTLVNNTVAVADIVQVGDPVFLDQAAGNYTVTVKDLTTTCAKSVTVNLLIPTAVDFTLATTPPYCITGQGNDANGTIKVTLANNDNPPYKYTIVQTSPATGLSYTQNTPVFTGLAVGFYDITVTSARGCSDTKNIEITTPAPVVAAAAISPFTCSSTNSLNATVVTVTGTGGTGTYSFSKDGTNYFTSNSSPADNKYTFSVSDTGASQPLTYYVRDANGCIDDYPITIDPFPRLISAIATQDTPIDCLNNTETIKVDISGGTNTPLEFTYQAYKDGVEDGGLVTVTGTTFNYPATTAGSYYEFEIFDNNTGCSIKSNLYEVPVFNTMQVIASAAADVDCNGNATGAIEINIINYDGLYDYKVFDGANPVEVFSETGKNTTANPFVIPFGLVAGNKYRVEVTQTAYPSCTVASADVIISEPAALDLSRLDVNVKKQNCNNAGAVLTIDVATIDGGTLGYEYAFVPKGDNPAGSYSPSPTKTIPTSQIAPLFDEVDVYVRDAKGCYEFVTVKISADPLPVITDVTVDSQCASATGYRIDVTATGVAPLKYSLDGVQFQDDAFFTVFAAADYTVTVMDKNGCTTTAATAVTVLEPLTLRGEVSTMATCDDPDGEITLYAAGGTVTPPNSYAYTIDNWANSQASAVFAGLAPGTYNFRVRDLVTRCEKEAQVIIDIPRAVTGITLTATDVTCKGGSDGSVSVSLASTNDNPIYTYALSGIDVLGNTVTRPAQESELFANLPAGSYTVTVTSGRGCEAQETAVVDEPALIVVAAPTVDGFGCTTGNSLNFATISVDPTAITGGSTRYVNYQFIKGTTQVYFGPNNVYTEYDLLGGTYTVNVYDSKGCMGSTAASVTIDPYIRLESADVRVTAAITCLDGESIQVKVTTNPAIPTVLDYAITDASGNSVAGNPDNQTGIFRGLPIGNYIITVSNPLTGCSIQAVHYVNNPNTFVLKAVKTRNVICFGSNEGTVELTIVDNQTNPDDEAGIFDYNITGPVSITGRSTSAGPETISGLTAGLYSVTATLVGSPFCSVSTSFTIVQAAAALDIAETHTAITCVAGNNDGTISVTATGGWPGDYQYQLLLGGTEKVAYSTQTEFTGLTAGIYRINVRDSKGCVDFVDVPLTNPTPIAFTAAPSAPSVSCFGDTSAYIEVTTAPTGGSGSYLYTLISTFADGTVTSNGPQVSPIFSNLGAGEYVVKVTDSWNCSAVSSAFTISEPTKVVASLAVKTTQSCDDLTVLELSATGGTPPYTYSTDPNFTTSTPIVGSSVTFPVPVGTYHYYVSDANGCTSYISNDIKIDPLEPLEANLDVQNAVVNCKGDASGVIVAHATGGLGNYVYTLLDGAGNAIVPVQSSPGRFDGLIAGFYQVKVESGDCEMTSEIVEIKEPLTGLTSNPVVTDVTCNGENNGKIEIIASGGTGKIMYAISPRMDQFFDSGVFDELAVGSYQVVIQDENGCFEVYDFDIKEPLPLTVSTVVDSIVEEICAGDKDGEFSIAITGGTLPYSVSLGDINGTYTTGTASQTEFDFTGLSGGNHFVFIRDANGCTTDWFVALPESINMNPIAVVQYDCVNNAAANTVTITIDDSITDPTFVDYALDGSGNFGPSSVFTNLAPGTHFVTARHSNGCEQQTINFEIKQVEPLTLVLNDGGLNEIVAVAAGGGGGYKYTLNGESYGSTPNFIIYKSGEYTVTVTDANGCVASVTKYMEYIDVCIPNNFTPNGDGINDVWAPGCTVNYKDLTFEVFDRYGRKVGNYRLGQYWDGRYNGTELPSGDYWYVLKLNDVKDAREFVGHFTLYR